MDLNSTGGVNMTPIGFLPFLKGKWCGWDSLPPGFQFPAKELVSSLNSFLEVGNNLFFIA
jgi:hypothetical protein